MRKFRIFLSCGQREHEKEHGKQVKNTLETHFKDKVHVDFAEMIFTSDALTENIFNNLRKCDAFVGIFHKRELLGDTGQRRSSLFVQQELGIASYLNKKKMVVFYKGEENDNEPILIEGIFKYIMNRPKWFKTIEDIEKELIDIIENEKWLDTMNKVFIDNLSTSIPPQLGLPSIKKFGNSKSRDI